MTRYINLEEQVDRDSTHARQRAFFHRMKARLREDLVCDLLLPFDEVKGALGASSRVYLGILYKIGEAYFVVDGYHRVSVARYQGVEMIDAGVIEVCSQLPIDQILERECKER